MEISAIEGIRGVRGVIKLVEGEFVGLEGEFRCGGGDSGGAVGAGGGG